MEYHIEIVSGYIKAVLSGRTAAGDTRAFWDAVLDAMRKHDLTRVLISVRASTAVFDVEKYGLSTAMAEIAVMRDAKIALVSDTDAVAQSHAYVERLARRRGMRVKAFRDEQAASAWLTGD